MKPVNRRRHGTFSLTKVRDLDIIPSCSLNQLTPVEREVMRKKYLLSLENRSSKELVEEEALYVELKRIEQNEKRFKQDRERLLRTLLGAESGLPDLPIDEDGPLGDPKKRKKGVASELDSPATPSSSLFASAIPKRAQSAKSAAHGTSRHHIRPLSLSDWQCQMHCTASSAQMAPLSRAPPPKLRTKRRTFVRSASLTPKRQSRPRSPRLPLSSASRSRDS